MKLAYHGKDTNCAADVGLRVLRHDHLSNFGNFERSRSLVFSPLFLLPLSDPLLPCDA
jgi:hypothetical protein